MDADGYGQAFEGMARLAMVGAVAVIAAVVAVTLGTVIGVPLLIWWAWHHVSIH